MKSYTINTLVDLLFDHYKETELKALEQLTFTGTMCLMVRELSRLSFNYLVIQGSRKPLTGIHGLAIGECIVIEDRVEITRLCVNTFTLKDLNKERWLSRLRNGAVPKHTHTLISRKLQVTIDKQFHQDMQQAVEKYKALLLER